ncbi:MAG TPA: excinuclease ABC subunit UvrB [Bacteroidales bacterium]|nr:excinuclease ABC subunit UvrB [Bacteroidales bacterium]HRZ48626.1 excinuclease ABC subunit UvrB [Bacteroidales bacterium]
MEFRLTSAFQPTGDQPEAIRQLEEGILRGDKHQVLLGVTGSGKTFTMANVIQLVQRPVLVLSHNKTLAAQLYSEFCMFFPENAVEFFISYYDYYQPEAFLPVTNTYIEKDLSINDEIEKLRLSATSQLLSGRRDVIVVSSVSCIYGIGNPEDFNRNVIKLLRGQRISRNKLLHALVDSLYSRTEAEFQRGNFRVRGDTVDVYPAYADIAYRLIFWGDEIESIESIWPDNGKRIEVLEDLTIYPANIFVTSKEKMAHAIDQIREDMVKQVEYFRQMGRPEEAKRLEDRTSYDIEMMQELGYCPGIENYSRYFDGRDTGKRPFCLLDYFHDDFLLFIDESHVTVPQIRAMYGGDRSRKQTLVEYGFRLPAALDNRPLKFDEFDAMVNQIVYVSATPADYELEQSGGVVVEQLIRPTGLLDPVIEVRPSRNQIDDLLHETELRIAQGERVLVTTLTKRLAEELNKYLVSLGINSNYIHSDVDTLDRVAILQALRTGTIDVLVGVNLLREGLDLPEVSLVAILDADKEGFLRSERSLTQTAGRAARNVNSRVIFYADQITHSMQRTIDETARRREKQLSYNEAHGITPASVVKPVETSRLTQTHSRSDKAEPRPYFEPAPSGIAADPVVKFMSPEQIEKAIKKLKQQMEAAVKELDFVEAARIRDEMYALQSRQS